MQNPMIEKITAKSLPATVLGACVPYPMDVASCSEKKVDPEKVHALAFVSIGHDEQSEPVCGN